MVIKGHPKSSWYRANRPIYVKVRDALRAMFPRVFHDTKPVPLKIGIFHELCAVTGDVFKEEEIKIFLKFWCNRTEYLWAIATREFRNDLNAVATPILAKDKEHSKKLVEQRIARIKLKKGVLNVVSSSTERASTPTV